MTLKAPFPWFGGKSKVAHIVWRHFGDVTNYVEPFFGSGAVLLGRPSSHARKIETINDADAYVSNFWRAIQHAPDEVAEWADYPPNENDLHARHAWIVARKDTLRAQVEGNPDYYDARIAGYWVYGLCLWIGSEFASGKGPWQVVDGKLIHLGDAGRGIQRRRIHLGTWRIKNSTNDFTRTNGAVKEWFTALADRLRYVRVASGDWSRVCGPSVTFKHGLTGLFFDPPYDGNERTSNLYTVDNHTIAHDVRAWCIENGDNPLLRIALCGYDTEHGELEKHGWTVVAWNAGKGYAGQGGGENNNGKRERVWFSPHCLGNLATLPLFKVGN